MDLATVLSQSIETNIDSAGSVRLVKAQFSEENDVQTVQLVSTVDTGLVPGTTLLVFEIGPSWKVAIPLDDGQTPTAAQGEKIIYSVDASDTIIAKMHLKADGEVLIENSLGSMALKADGQIDLNGNLTVDPT